MISLGAKYKRHASITNVLLRRGKIIGHLDIIMDCADKLLTRWRTNNNDPTYIHLNMFEQMQQLVLDSFGHIFFDYSFQTTQVSKRRVKSLVVFLVWTPRRV
jgi:hypothetical protein